MKIADTRLWSGKPSRREGLPSPRHRHPSSPSSGLSHPAKRPLSSGERGPFIHPPQPFCPAVRPARHPPQPPGHEKRGTPVLPPLLQRYNKNARNANPPRRFFTLSHSSGTCRPHSSPRIFHPEREHSLYPVAALTVKAHGPAAELHSYDAHLISQPGTAVGGIAPARTALLGAQVLP